jgi:TRAP-type C4-dicarboxylate transport system substrate-binding protein
MTFFLNRGGFHGILAGRSSEMKPNTRSFKLTIALGLILCAALWGKTIFKLGTLAPQESTWVSYMQKMIKEVQTQSNGEIGFRLYPGGVLGDERDMVRRMQIGQLHGGAMTTVGLSLIQKQALIFQLPLLFESEAELDYVRDKLNARMAESFEKNGYILLGWTDVGPAYIFSKHKVQSREDLRRTKIWGWTDDQIAMALFKEAGINPIPLSISEVMPSLQTGVVDTVPSTPYACVALQWFSRIKYMMDMPLSLSIGATVITKKQFDRLSPSEQELLLKVGKEYHRQLTLKVREDNIKAVAALKENGIELIPATPGTQQEWEKIALGVRQKLVGKIYSQQLLDEVIRLSQEFRSRRPR